MAGKETERDRLREDRINGKVEERERDGLRERWGAIGGRDRLIKVKGERNRSCGKNFPPGG